MVSNHHKNTSLLFAGALTELRKAAKTSNRQEVSLTSGRCIAAFDFECMENLQNQALETNSVLWSNPEVVMSNVILNVIEPALTRTYCLDSKNAFVSNPDSIRSALYLAHMVTEYPPCVAGLELREITLLKNVGLLPEQATEIEDIFHYVASKILGSSWQPLVSIYGVDTTNTLLLAKSLCNIPSELLTANTEFPTLQIELPLSVLQD